MRWDLRELHVFHTCRILNGRAVLWFSSLEIWMWLTLSHFSRSLFLVVSLLGSKHKYSAINVCKQFTKKKKNRPFSILFLPHLNLMKIEFLKFGYYIWYTLKTQCINCNYNVFIITSSSWMQFRCGSYFSFLTLTRKYLSCVFISRAPFSLQVLTLVWAYDVALERNAL